jgi:hypothetical protein
MNLIEQHKSEIEQLCNNYNVEKMYVFGSILNQNFTKESDVDLVVKFKSFDLSFYFENYFKLKEKLELILKRKVDLIEEQTLKNPFLIQSINKSKKMIYG